MSAVERIEGGELLHLAERAVLRRIADCCSAAGADVAARVLVIGDDFRFEGGRRALEHDVARSRLTPVEKELVLAFVDDLVTEGMSTDVAMAWSLWYGRYGRCAPCALARLRGAPGDRCDEHRSAA